jgi:Ras-related GTP-binding protein C/D
MRRRRRAALILPLSTTPAMPVSSPPSRPASPLPPQNILLLGLRRSGKSSLLSVVYKALPPHETLFLDSTLRSHHLDVCAWEPVRFWDGPGLSASATEGGAGAAAAVQEKGKATGTAGGLEWTQVGAVIFVIDAQDDYFDALARLHSVLLDAYAHNPEILFHVFVHKVDGLSDDYKYGACRMSSAAR